jgi:hypothetical protein
MSRFVALMFFASSAFAHPGHGKPGGFHFHEDLLTGLALLLWFAFMGYGLYKTLKAKK